MTNITIYDTEAETIQRVADENDVTVAEIIEMLIDYVEDMKSDYDLK